MEPRRDEIDLAAELRMLRPTPRQEFAAELDARAAAGFPPQRQDGRAPLARFIDRLREMPARRVLVPIGGFAVAMIVVATAVVAISAGVGDNSRRQLATVDSSSAHSNAKRLPELDSLNGSYTPGSGPEAKPSAAGASSESSGIEYSSAPPIVSSHLLSGESSSSATGPYASGASHRDIARDAQITLGTDAAEVRDVSAKVFEAVHSYDGIVLSSSIDDGAGSDAGAHFELLIPSAKLNDAMASLSGLAEVRSRHESSQDITAPTVSLSEHLQDSNAKIEGLLGQLANASSDSERAAVEAELRSERNRAAALRSRLSALSRRANLSRVSLRIATGSTSSGSDSGGWGIDDALGDAGHILAVAAGVTVIGLAILGPLALLALLIWAIGRIWVKRSRERALT